MREGGENDSSALVFNLGLVTDFFCRNTQSHVQRQRLHLAGEFIAFLEFRLHQKVHLNPLYVVNLFICQIHLFASVRWLGPARDDFGVAWAALCSLVALSSLDSGTSTSTGSAARPSPLPSASFFASFPRSSFLLRESRFVPHLQTLPLHRLFPKFRRGLHGRHRRPLCSGLSSSPVKPPVSPFHTIPVAIPKPRPGAASTPSGRAPPSGGPAGCYSLLRPRPSSPRPQHSLPPAKPRRHPAKEPAWPHKPCAT